MAANHGNCSAIDMAAGYRYDRATTARWGARRKGHCR
jgi:hypothetical protein